uniref:Uncharacterized protein n=1 Tax=Arundo donax TaxID=35708 RepID=A0A0A9GKX2_ARUDO
MVPSLETGMVSPRPISSPNQTHPKRLATPTI